MLIVISLIVRYYSVHNNNQISKYYPRMGHFKTQEKYRMKEKSEDIDMKGKKRWLTLDVVSSDTELACLILLC